MDYKEKTIKSERIYSGRVLTLKVDTVEMPNKKYSKREIVEHPGAVVIIPVLPDGRILLVHNHRTAISRSLMELPAGLIELGEEPNETARRELMEETGFAAEEMVFLFDAYSSPGYSNEKQQFFLAKGLVQKTDEIDEEIHSHSILSLDEILQMIDHCGIMDTKTIIGTLYLERVWNKHFPQQQREESGNENA